MIWRLFPYVTKADILDHLRVQLALADNLLQDLEHQAIERGVLKATLAGLGQGCPDCESDNNIVGVLRGTVGDARSAKCLPDGEKRKKWGLEGAYICSSGLLLPGVMWERTLERRWVAIVRER
jgi:hypothetical protein